jgi:hypothetical protein
VTRCEKGRDKPKLKKKPARLVCKRCGMKARKKDHLCKPRKIKK